MKRVRRFSALLLTAAMMVSLAACSSGTPETATSSEVVPSEPLVITPESHSQPATADGHSTDAHSAAVEAEAPRDAKAS